MTCAIGSELVSRFVFYSPIDLLLSCWCYTVPSIPVSMYAALSRKLSCSQSRRCTNLSVWSRNLGQLLCWLVADVLLLWCVWSCLYKSQSCTEQCAYLSSLLWCLIEALMLCRGRLKASNWMGLPPSGNHSGSWLSSLQLIILRGFHPFHPIMSGPGGVQPFIHDTLSWISAIVMVIGSSSSGGLLLVPLATEHWCYVMPPFHICFSIVQSPVY